MRSYLTNSVAEGDVTFICPKQQMLPEAKMTNVIRLAFALFFHLFWICLLDLYPDLVYCQALRSEQNGRSHKVHFKQFVLFLTLTALRGLRSVVIFRVEARAIWMPYKHLSILDFQSTINAHSAEREQRKGLWTLTLRLNESKENSWNDRNKTNNWLWLRFYFAFFRQMRKNPQISTYLHCQIRQGQPQEFQTKISISVLTS